MEIGILRRRDRAVSDKREIEEILKRERVCHLAMCVGEQPYVIPMIFVYDRDTMYFHCAEVGQKLDFLRKNNKVCFEVQGSATDKVVENSDKPCDWGITFESVVGYGTAEIIDDREEKLKVYDLLVEKLAPEGYVHSRDGYVEKKLKGTYIIKVDVTSMSGKKWDGKKPGAGQR